MSSIASGFLRSTPTERRLRLETLAGTASTPRGPVGRSSRMMSAPRSANIMQANGPGPIPAISMMRYPLSGPMGAKGTVRLDADRHLERQLAEGPAAPRGAVARVRPARRPVHAGDEAGRRGLPRHALQRPGLRGRL